MTDSHVPPYQTEHERLREKVALENGFSLYKRYSEKAVAGFLRKDISTLKRWRRGGLFKGKFETRMGVDGVEYFGINIADLIIWGTGKWPNEPADMTPENSSSALTSSPSEPAAKPGIAAGGKATLPDASASARRILTKQSED